MPTLPNKIAIVFDCDDTLAKDSTGWLLEQCGEKASDFFKEAGKKVRDGWDPPLAYLNMIINEAHKDGKLGKFTKPYLEELANSCDGIFFPGTHDLFDRLRNCVQGDQRYKDIGIKVGCYIISGGIEEFIRETPVGKTADEVWGSSFDYNVEGHPILVKNVMSFTEKTRYLFCLNKGVEGQARNTPYIVNTPEHDRENRAVPFCNMIYVGDGPSDVPSMSLITYFGGQAIGILGEKANRAWEIGFGRRSNFTIPTDFREDEVGYKHLKNAVIQVAERIRRRWESAIGPFPSYG